MLRLEARPQPSRAMSLASPLIALALTVVIAGILFVVLGKDPLRGLSMFFVEPLRTGARADRGRAEGDAAGPVRARARGLLPRERLEHRRRGPVPARRDRRRRRRAVRHDARHRGAAVVLMTPVVADGGHPGRHGLGVDHRAAARPLQRERDPGQPDARLRRAACCSTTSCSGRGRTRRASTSRRRKTFVAATLLPNLVPQSRLHVGLRDHARARGGVLGCSCSARFRGFQLQVGGLAPRRGALCRLLGAGPRCGPRCLVSGGMAGLAGAMEAAGPLRPAHAARLDRLRVHRDHRLLRRPAASGRLPLRRRAAVDAPDRRRARAVAARAAARR